MPSSEKHSDDGMVSVEIALGTFSIVIMIALVLSVFAAAMTTQNLCTALSAGIRESARGGNGQETAHGDVRSDSWGSLEFCCRRKVGLRQSASSL